MQKKRCIWLALMSIFVLVVFASSAFGASAAKRSYDAAERQFRSVVAGELNAQVALDAMLAINASALSVYDRSHLTFYVSDLYYRVGDYDKCREWALKVLDTQELYNVPIRQGGRDFYSHGLVAVVILANAAAEFGKPEDIDMLEGRLASGELVTNVFIRYCWTGGGNAPRTSLRTTLRFYKALAYKNAGDLEAMQEVLQISSFRTGDIRVGNRFIPLQEAANLLTN